MLVTRSDNHSALESLRLVPDPKSYPLGPLPSGYVVPIVDRLTQRPADAPQVVADPEAGWTALIDRLGADLEQGAQLLPQQLKIALLGLRTLRPMNVRGYERLGRAEGLEALFVESAVADAAAASGLDKRKVLDLLLALVDRPNRRKGEPRSADQLVATAGIAPDRAPMIATALKVLEARELVRTTSTGWQLDHDYLARGILRAEANAERWRTRLAQLARQHEAASGIWGWWRTLLTPWEQVSFLAAWLRGRRPYGAHASFARTSVVRLLPPAGAALAGMLVIYVVDDYLTSSTPLNVLSYDQSLSDDEASAFVAIAQDGPVARGFFAWRSFNDLNDARKAAGKAPAVARAITRLDARAAGHFRDRLVVPAVLFLSRRSATMPLKPWAASTPLLACWTP